MSETLAEALQYAAQDSIWLDRPVHQLRRLKVLAAEVARLTAENAEYASGHKFQMAAVEKGILHCERECAALKTDLEKVRGQLTQVQDVLSVQDAQFANERRQLNAEIERGRKRVTELEEKLARLTHEETTSA